MLNRLRFVSAGQSHGPAITAVLEGVPAGLALDAADFAHDLARRQKRFGAGGRQGIEQDTVVLTAGVLDGHTTGAPLCLVVNNRDHENWKGKDIAAMTVPRPGHTDLVGAVKYRATDLRFASERSSARSTVVQVAAGVVAKKLLALLGVRTGAFVRQVGDISMGQTWSLDAQALEALGERADEAKTSCPDPATAQRMDEAIRKIMVDKDTLGGVIEAFATGVPTGLGSYSQWNEKLDARLGALLLSVPSVKAVAFGAGEEVAAMTGTQAQDPIFLDGEDLVRRTNRAGGLEGGVTNGQPVVARVTLKPIASTLVPQPSVDVARQQSAETRYERSDFCTLPRAAVVVEAMLALGLCDALLQKTGGDHIDEVFAAAAQFRQPRLADLPAEDKKSILFR